MGYVTRLRILTNKSVLGFGYERYRDLRVQELLSLNKQRLLISSYYHLGKISFTEDVLRRIGITKEMEIDKPGKLDRVKAKEMERMANNNLWGEKTEKEKMGASSKAKSNRRKNFDRKEINRHKTIYKPDYNRYKNQK